MALRQDHTIYEGAVPKIPGKFDGAPIELLTADGEPIEHLVNAPAITGAIIHAGIHAGHTLGLDTPEHTAWSHRLYDKRHSFIKNFAAVGRLVVPMVEEELTAPSGYDSIWSSEINLSPSADSIIAASAIQQVLEFEQAQYTDEPGPFELALRSNPHTMQPDEKRTMQFYRKLDALPKDFPLSADQIKKLLHTSRIMTFTDENHDTVIAPSVHADIVWQRTPEGDTEARQIAGMFDDVLRSRHACDPDLMKKMEFPSLLHEDRRPITGREIGRLAVRCMMERRLILGVDDIKTQPHIGDSWEAVEGLWKDADGDMHEIYRSGNLKGSTPDKLALQSLWHPMRYDVAKTNLAVSNLIRRTIFESGSKELRERYREILNTIEQGLVLVDTDIRRNSRTLRRQVIPGEPKLGYTLLPSMSELDIPEQLSVARVDLQRDVELEKRWGRDIRAAHFARIATQSEIEYSTA